MEHRTISANRNPDYPVLAQQLTALLAGERDAVTNAAQFSAFIFQSLSDINWAGFYLLRDERLVLGPFQGKVACVHIPLGRGVCGRSAASQLPLIVDDVHAFADHIVCDSASNSEIVLPVMVNGALYGVFDIDSPVLARFQQSDQDGLMHLLDCFIAATDLNPC